MDHFTVAFGIILLVGDIPAKSGKKRIQEVAPELGLVVLSGEIRGAVFVETVYKLEDAFGRGH